MKLYVFFAAFAAACGGAPAKDGAAPAAAPELALLETHTSLDGTALPPRSDAPRTVVVFFASW